MLSIIAVLTPSVRRLGVLYNPGETNSTAVVARLRSAVATKFHQFGLIERPITSTADIPLSLESLQGRIDAMLLPPDNTVFAAIRQIARISLSNRIPLFATTSDAVKEGALATLNIDYRELGKEAARLALEVLGGKDPGKLPIQYAKNPQIIVGSKTANALRVSLDSVRGRPDVTVQD
jgi:putative ABC transport system substrate-binding protein